MRKIDWSNRPGNGYSGNQHGQGCARAALICPILALFACTGSPSPETATPPTNTVDGEGCVAGGRLRTDLVGGIRASLDWQAHEMVCEGMPRPDDSGARIRLSGPLGSDSDVKTLTIILGLPHLSAGVTGAELPTNVTLVEEGAGRFFGTPDTNSCWTDVTSHELVEGSSNEYVIGGQLYCASPLPELNGSASVTFTELSFTGSLNWDQAETQLGEVL
ncbi:MAG: hypothetical protein ACR2Q3_00845 [Woeseiaceae bacterium]